MLRKVVATALVGAGLVIVTPTAPAQAAESYVTKAEFRRVSKGMSIRRVHRIFDTNGRQTSYFDGTYIPDSQMREYRTRSRWGSVNVDFEKRRGVWRLTSKYAFWG